MKVTLFLLIIQYLTVVIKCEMQSFIVGGEAAKEGQFPYMAHIGTRCTDVKQEYLLSWICGSTIINQNILLTAGHCVYECSEDAVMAISVGCIFAAENSVTTAHSFLVHQDYQDISFDNDIALVRTTTSLEFNDNISRVALMKHPPYKVEAKIAGWGFVNEVTSEFPLSLRYTKQYVLDAEKCSELLEVVTEGKICAGHTNPEIVVAQGDSGGGLIVHDYIQIGIVSSKRPDRNSHITIYTDVGYFYDWILANTEEIMCHEFLPNVTYLRL